MANSNSAPYTHDELTGSGVKHFIYERASVIHYKKDDGSIVVLLDLGDKVGVVLTKDSNTISSNVLNKDGRSFDDFKNSI
ncbi:hypothetical protein [Aeromonas hydrophila]